MLASQSSPTVGTLISRETVLHADQVTDWKEILASGLVLLFNAEIDKSTLMVHASKLRTTVKPGMREESAVDAMVATISTPPGNATTFLKVTANQMKCCILGNIEKFKPTAKASITMEIVLLVNLPTLCKETHVCFQVQNQSSVEKDK